MITIKKYNGNIELKTIRRDGMYHGEEINQEQVHIKGKISKLEHIKRKKKSSGRS